MITIKDQLSETLRKYGPLRKVYRAVAGGEGKRRRARLAAFYRQFIAPGDMVFDVGANIGVYTEVFISLGARVVAVEPNPACAKQIHWTAPAAAVWCAAVGDRLGTCRLFVNELNLLSSVSETWVKGEQAATQVLGKWENEIEVPMITVDEIVKAFGMPRFLKLDVEGFEVQALRGMSKQPEFLSFEFHHHSITKDSACFDLLAKETVFDYVLEEPEKLEIGQWVSREEVLRRIITGKVATFGDVIAYLPKAAS